MTKWQELLKEEHKVNAGVRLKDYDGTEFNFTCFDLEWIQATGEIYAASFCDFRYDSKVLHEHDYQERKTDFGVISRESQLLRAINAELERYEAIIGHNITGEDSDIDHIIARCKKHGVPHAFQKTNKGNNTYYTFKGGTARIIDTMNIFEKKIVQLSIHSNGYRNFKLETISQYFLGEGKFSTAEKSQASSDIDLQKCYVFKDSLLVRRLLEVGDVKDGKTKMDRGLLGMFWAISDIIEKAKQANDRQRLPFTLEKVISTNITTWWSQILDDYGGQEWAEYAQSRLKPRKFAAYENGIPIQYRVKYKNQGGGILDPEKHGTVGQYTDVEVVDVASLYPSMVINYNLSFDTVSSRGYIQDMDPASPTFGEMIQVLFSCGRPECELDGVHIPEIIPQIGDTWFCNPSIHKKGLFSERSRIYKDMRIKYKNAGDVIMATGLKIVLNGGYGGFANEYWKYRDMRIAEAVTAFGRFTTFKKMKPKAEELGFKVLYGDTDSLFLLYQKTDGKKLEQLAALISWCQKELDIILEHEKTFKWLQIIGAKHYMGRTSKGKLMIKGMEGKKGDRCKWIRNTFDAVVDAIDKEQDPTVPYYKAVDDLRNNRIDHDHLKTWIKLSQDPNAYKGNCSSKQIGLLHDAKQGDLVWSFKAKRGVTLEYGNIDKDKYIKHLRSVVEEPIKLMGFSIDGSGETYKQETGLFD